MPTRFAIVGDVHFCDANFHQHAMEEREGNWMRGDLVRYVEARRAYYPKLAAEIRDAKVDFVVQLGDLLQGHWDKPEQAADELHQALDWLQTFGAPCYAIRGNHDDELDAAKACDKVLAPYLANLEKASSLGFSYEFRKPGAHFVFVDCLEAIENKETITWLRQLQDRRRKDERLFIFAHQPIYPVARPYFSDAPFLKIMRESLANIAVDGYFCGHTHNQTLTFHPGLGAGGIIQAKTAAVGVIGSEAIPLEQTRALLLPKDARYFCGYLEDSLPSWLLVECDARSVKLTWHSIGNGIDSILRWNQPSDAKWEKTPPARPLERINDVELSTLRSARLHMTFHGSRKPGKRVLLNGTAIGDAPLTGSFPPRTFLEIAPQNLKLLRRHNSVVLENVPAEKLCWGGIYLEVETTNGRRVRSCCADKIYDAEYTPEGHERPPAIVACRAGETLGPANVSFA